MKNILNLTTMEAIKEAAVRAYTGMVAIFPQYGVEETLDVSDLIPKFNGAVCVNNSTVAFVDDNQVFVIPYFRSVMRVLSDNGFKDAYFYVPFSNWDYPKTEAAKWKALREAEKEADKQNFVSDCEKYCDDRNIGCISAESLANCFEMPISGVDVKHLYFEDTYYPVMNQNFLDCRCEHLGHYCTNNGRVVFVYRNGRTYVTKGYSILKELQDAGYTEAGLFVPFSNGEEIQDPFLKAKWDAVKK